VSADSGGEHTIEIVAPPVVEFESPAIGKPEETENQLDGEIDTKSTVRKPRPTFTTTIDLAVGLATEPKANVLDGTGLEEKPGATEHKSE